MYKYINHKTYFYAILFKIAIFNQLYSQEKIILNKNGHTFFEHVLGNKFLSLTDVCRDSLIIDSNTVKGDVINIKSFTLSSTLLNLPDSIQIIYGLLCVKDNKLYTLHLSYKKNNFINCTSYGISDTSRANIYLHYLNNNKIEMSLGAQFLNSAKPKTNSSLSNNWSDLVLVYKFNNLKYNRIKISNDVFFTLGTFDQNNNGKLDFGIDFIFTNFSDKTYFFISQSKTCKKISKKHILFYDSNNVFLLSLKSLTLLKLTKINLKRNEIQKSIDLLSVFHSKPSNVLYKDRDSKLVSFDDYFFKGKYVYVNIWTMFCPPCLIEIPKLDSLVNRNSDKLEVISLLDKDITETILKSKYYADHENGQKFGYSNKSLNAEFLLRGYPHGILFNPDGVLVDFMHYEKLITFINDINSKQPK